MQWFAFGGYNARPFVAFGSRSDAALLQEYLATKQSKHLKFREIAADLGELASRVVEVVDLSDRLIDIAIAEEIHEGNYEFGEEEDVDA